VERGSPGTDPVAPKSAATNQRNDEHRPYRNIRERGNRRIGFRREERVAHGAADDRIRIDERLDDIERRRKERRDIQREDRPAADALRPRFRHPRTHAARSTKPTHQRLQHPQRTHIPAEQSQIHMPTFYHKSHAFGGTRKASHHEIEIRKYCR